MEPPSHLVPTVSSVTATGARALPVSLGLELKEEVLLGTDTFGLSATSDIMRILHIRPGTPPPGQP